MRQIYWWAFSGRSRILAPADYDDGNEARWSCESESPAPRRDRAAQPSIYRVASGLAVALFVWRETVAVALVATECGGGDGSDDVVASPRQDSSSARHADTF